MMIGGFVQKKPSVTVSSPGSKSKKIDFKKDVKKVFHDGVDVLDQVVGRNSVSTPTSYLVMFQTSALQTPLQTSALFFFALVRGPSMEENACSHKVRIFIHIAYIINNFELCIQLTTENGGAYGEDVFGGKWMVSKGKIFQITRSV